MLAKVFLQKILALLYDGDIFYMAGAYLSSKLKRKPRAICPRFFAYGVAVAGAALMGVEVPVGRKVPGPGVMGVLVGGRVAVGVTRFTGICKTCPTNKLFGLSMLFSSMMASMVLAGAFPPPRADVSNLFSTWTPLV